MAEDEEEEMEETAESATADEEAAEEEAEGQAEEGDVPVEASEGEAAPKKEKKKRKVIRRRKTKKEKERPLTSAIRLAVESGKVEFGARSGAVAGKEGKARLFVIAENTPKEIRLVVSEGAKAAGIPIIEFDGSTMELGSVCGKPFPVSVLSVFEAGSSNILSLAKK